MQVGRVAPRIAAQQARLAGVGADQAEEDPQGRRLAGAVGPEEAVDLAGSHLEVEPIERARSSERLDQPAHRDRAHHGRQGTTSPALRTFREFVPGSAAEWVSSGLRDRARAANFFVIIVSRRALTTTTTTATGGAVVVRAG